MSNEEITKELQKSIINLLRKTNDPEMKEKLNFILHGDNILRCKCPQCYHKFEPKENMKLATKVL